MSISTFLFAQILWNQRQRFICEIPYSFSELSKKKNKYYNSCIELMELNPPCFTTIGFCTFWSLSDKGPSRKRYAKLPNSSTDLEGDFLVLFAFFYLVWGRDATEFLSSWFSYDFTRITLSFNPIFFFVTLSVTFIIPTGSFGAARRRYGFYNGVYRISFMG